MQELARKSGLGEELLSGIVAVLRERGASRAVLFGSRARGDFADASDIDIAFWGEVDEAMLWLDMEQLPTIHKIDLVKFEGITNDGFRGNILRDGVELV